MRRVQGLVQIQALHARFSVDTPYRLVQRIACQGMAKGPEASDRAGRKQVLPSRNDAARSAGLWIDSRDGLSSWPIRCDTHALCQDAVSGRQARRSGGVREAAAKWEMAGTQQAGGRQGLISDSATYVAYVIGRIDPSGISVFKSLQRQCRCVPLGRRHAPRCQRSRKRARVDAPRRELGGQT